MKTTLKNTICSILLLFVATLISAQDTDQQGSNIQNLTPSKLIGKGQWDIKWFNNIYTETEDTFNGDIPRNTFFTSTLDVFTGVGENRRVNLGVLLEFRSNTIEIGRASCRERV